jgi:hypothetical protein
MGQTHYSLGLFFPYCSFKGGVRLLEVYKIDSTVDYQLGLPLYQRYGESLTPHITDTESCLYKN